MIFRRLLKPLLVLVLLPLFQFAKGQDRPFLIADFDSTIVDSSDMALLKQMLIDYKETSPYSLERLDVLSEFIANYWDERHWHEFNLFYLDQAESVVKDLTNSKEKDQALFYYADALNNKAYALNILGTPDSALNIYKKAGKIFKSIKDSSYYGTVLNNIGYQYDNDGTIDSALYYYDLAIEIFRKINDSIEFAGTLGNKAGLIKQKGNISLALNIYDTILRYQQNLEDVPGLGITYSNIANVYASFNDSISELKYLQKARSIKKQLGDDLGLIWSNIKLGGYYTDYNRPELAEQYFDSAKTLINQIGDSENKVTLYNAWSELKVTQGDYQKAEEYASKAIQLAKEQNIIYDEALGYLNLAEIQLKQKSYGATIQWAKKGLEIANDKEFTSLERLAHSFLAQAYEGVGNYKESLTERKLWEEMNSKNEALEGQRQLLNNNFKRQFEMQKLNDSLKQQVLQEQAEMELMAKDIQLKESRFRGYLLGGGIGFIALISLLLYRNNRRKHAQNLLIEKQNKEISKQRDIAHQNFKIAEQAKDEVEVRNQEILDSIKYAQRLQQAVLPPQKLVKEWLTNSFILYKPKDIVSGDFYWMETAQYTLEGKQHSLVFFAAADCTGHGVPGAMVSVVCAGALNRAVNEFKLTDVGEILNKVTELVIESFSKSEERIQDGMDIALCALDIGRKTLYASGANNPIWIISKSPTLQTEENYKSFQNDEEEELYLHEFKSLKKAVGLGNDEKSFSTKVIQLKAGDGVFLFSDGYADQFGGDNGKKFKYQNFKRLLLSNFHLNMEKQKQLIESTFENWKGDLEQLDDICIIGVKINGKERKNFTKRELEVIEYLETGLPSKLIAEKMNISPHTVDTYRRRVLAKTNTYNTTELLNYCKQKEII